MAEMDVPNDGNFAGLMQLAGVAAGAAMNIPDQLLGIGRGVAEAVMGPLANATGVRITRKRTQHHFEAETEKAAAVASLIAAAAAVAAAEAAAEAAVAKAGPPEGFSNIPNLRLQVKDLTDTMVEYVKENVRTVTKGNTNTTAHRQQQMLEIAFEGARKQLIKESGYEKPREIPDRKRGHSVV